MKRLTADQFIVELELSVEWQIVQDFWNAEIIMRVTEVDGNYTYYRGPSLSGTSQCINEYIEFLNRLGVTMKANARKESALRVLSPEEFIKKICRFTYPTPGDVPLIEVLPNWQLRLSIPGDNEELGRWLGPNPSEMSEAEYMKFLVSIDILSKTNLAERYMGDQTGPMRMQR